MKFNMTAELERIKAVKKDTSPCKLRFRETNSMEDDAFNISNFCQIHKCHDYCLRKGKNGQEQNQKVCTEHFDYRQHNMQNNLILFF